MAKSFRGNAGVLIISIAYFGLIGGLSIVAGLRAALLRLRWLTGLGTISYGLYLYHVVIYAVFDYYFMFEMGVADCWWLGALKIVTTVGIACLSWYFVEKPILKLKDRYTYGRASDDPCPPTASAMRRCRLSAIPQKVEMVVSTGAGQNADNSVFLRLLAEREWNPFVVSSFGFSRFSSFCRQRFDRFPFNGAKGICRESGNEILRNSPSGIGPCRSRPPVRV